MRATAATGAGERPRTVATDAHTRAASTPTAAPQVATDELVMILISRDAWEAVEALARRIGRTPQETLGIALKRMEAAVEGP